MGKSSAEYNKTYHEEHKDDIHDRQKQYRAANASKIKARMQRYRAAKRQKLAKQIKQWRTDNSIAVRAYSADYRTKNLPKITARQAKYHRDAKIDVIRFYSQGSMCCALCPERRIGALTIDHVAGAGSKHRKSVNCDGSLPFYRWLKKQSYPEGYRVLCSNCNWKSYISGIIYGISKRAQYIAAIRNVVLVLPSFNVPNLPRTSMSINSLIASASNWSGSSKYSSEYSGSYT